MKAKFGAIVVAGSGKIGGHVASRNRAGAYFRTKVTPVNPNTSFQAAARSRLTSFAQNWRALTAAQRIAWNAAVGDFSKTDIFGDLKNPTGFNLYQKLNNVININGGAALTSPPVPEAIPTISALSLVMDATIPTYTATFSPAIDISVVMMLFATAPVSAGKSFVKSEYRYIGTISDADVSPFNFTALYTAKFGVAPIGQKVFLKFVPAGITSGQQGVALSASTIVIA